MYRVSLALSGILLALHCGAHAATITSAAEVDGFAGQAITYQITADNAPTSFTATNLAAIGATLNKFTGLITATPPNVGTFTLTVSAKSKTTTATKKIKFVIVKNSVAFTSSNTASGVISTAFSFQLTSPVTTPTFSASGLPPGLTLGSKTGLISGQPTVAGVFATTVTAQNSTTIATGLLSITINGGVAPPSAVGLKPLSATVGIPYLGAFTAKGAPPFTFVVTSPLPDGVATTNGNFISGTPTTAGITTLTIVATNAFGSASATVTFSIAPPNGAPLLTSPLAVNAEVGESFAYSAQAAGKAPIVYSFDPSKLPRGLESDGSGNITGVPFDPGVFVTPFSAANSAGADNETLTITVASLAAGNTSAAIKFTDQYRDANQQGNVLHAGAFTYTAVVNTPGFDPATFESNLSFDIAVGAYEYSDVLGNAALNGRFSPGKSALFVFMARHAGRTVRLGTLSIALIKSGQIKIVERLKGTSAVGGVQTLRAEELKGLTQSINEMIPVKIQIGSAITAAFYVPCQGLASLRAVQNRQSGGILTLNSVRLKGSGSGAP